MSDTERFPAAAGYSLITSLYGFELRSKLFAGENHVFINQLLNFEKAVKPTYLLIRYNYYEENKYSLFEWSCDHGFRLDINRLCD